jgi:hypothetical protein
MGTARTRPRSASPRWAASPRRPWSRWPPHRRRTAAAPPPHRRAASLRCVWSFRDRPPRKDWRFQSKLPDNDPDNYKHIVPWAAADPAWPRRRGCAGLRGALGRGGRPGRAGARPAARAPPLCRRRCVTAGSSTKIVQGWPNFRYRARAGRAAAHSWRARRAMRPTPARRCCWRAANRRQTRTTSRCPLAAPPLLCAPLYGRDRNHPRNQD